MQPDFTKLKPVVSTEQPDFAKLKPVVASEQGSNITNNVQDTYGAFFPASSTDSPVVAGLKAAGNLPSSAFNLAKGVATAVLHPIKTIKSIGGVAVGGVEKLIAGQQGQEQNFDAFTQILKDRYGSLENLQKTATNDPFGFGSDILTAISGGAALIGKGAEASSAVSKIGGLVTKPVSKTAEKIAEGVSSTAKFATSQATGLNPETITQIIKNPEAFKTSNIPSRIETTNAVAEALDTRLQELSDLGKGYDTLRKGTSPVTIPENTIKNVLDKYGVKIEQINNTPIKVPKKGELPTIDFNAPESPAPQYKIVTTPESRPLSTGDRLALEDFINNYGGITNHTPNSFLNTREALSNLAKYDSTKTNISTQISRDLRSEYDKLGKAQIPGLQALDTQYAPERQLLGQLKKDIFTPQGELKDGAISKIANITGKGKENLLSRMKEIVPDIEERVRVIKAVEDIERSSGIKTGTYLKAGATLIGASTGNVPVIIAAILAQPQIAVPLLKGYGYVGQKAAPILNTLKVIANDVNNFKLPAPILNQVEKVSSNFDAGLSIKNITKNISLAEKGTMRDFADYVAGAYKPTGKTLSDLKRDAQEIADKYKFTSSTKGDKSLANQFGEYLDSIRFDKSIAK